MLNFVHNCCDQPTPKPIGTRPPCGREILSGCGSPFQNTIFDKIWGKPFWLRPEMKDLGVSRPPQGPIEIENIMRNGSTTGVFNPEKADPAFEWDHTDPIQPYSLCEEENPQACINTDRLTGPEQFYFYPEWPLSEKIAAAETDTGICDNKYYKLITHYPSVGRPYQRSDTSKRSKGLMLSNVVPDLFPGKQVETYNYTQGVANIIISNISHDKNQHTNTAYPGTYWISWWNSIHPGNVKGYEGVDLFSSSIVDKLSRRIKCDSIASESCYKEACDGITLIDNQNSRANVIKVSSGINHTCVLLDNGKIECFGDLNGSDDPDAPNFLAVPEELKEVNTFKDINCSRYISIGVYAEGITCWGLDNNGCCIIPENVKPNNLIKMAVGGGNCIALLSSGGLTASDGRPRNNSGSGVIELWGSGGYLDPGMPRDAGRLTIRPRVAIKDFWIVDGQITFNDPKTTIYNKVSQGSIIPFWGPRYSFFQSVKEYENGIDEFGLQNDPISIELEYVDVWAGMHHVIGLLKTPVYISVLDLGKHVKDEEGKIIGIEDVYDNDNALYNIDLRSRITVRLFPWGNGMPGDPYQADRPGTQAIHLRQSHPNYLWMWNGGSCKEGAENAPVHALTDFFETKKINYTDYFYNIENTLFLITNSNANHTVFAKKLWYNCPPIDTSFGAISRKFGDPALCMHPLTKEELDCCACRGSWDDPECCKTAPYGGSSTYWKEDGQYWSCCDFTQNEGDKYECCNSDYGVMLDAWGDDRYNQITEIGLRSVPEYFSTPYINKNLRVDPRLFQTGDYYIRCALGYDRTVVTLSVKPTEEEIGSGRYKKGQYKSDIFIAGKKDCIKNIFLANNGPKQLVEHLDCGMDHNIIIQKPDTPPKIDYPYFEEIDKSSNIGWKFQNSDPNELASSPRILLRNRGNTADWHQPIFDTETASRLLFDLNVSIIKYKKERIGEKETDVEKQKLEFKVNKTEKQSNGISVSLIGTRGDQRIKPFTGATCDCVWSDYATDSFKLGGHQGTLLNHIGYDENTAVRDTTTAYQWVEFNQLRGANISGHGAGGHEQPWKNFDSAATKAFNYEYWPENIWDDGELKPKINYYYAPANSFTHNIIEIPPGKFPSQLSYYCRSKYAYGGNNNIIQNWCDPCFAGITNETSSKTGWMGRLGCTGCEYNYNEQLCTGCTFNSYGVWECPSTAPKIRDVYDYTCTAKVFGDILPDEIIIRTEQVNKIKPILKNKLIYQKEIKIDPETGTEEIIWWNVGEVTNIKRKTFTFIPYKEETDVFNLKKQLIRSQPIYFRGILNQKEDSEYEFTGYQYISYENNCTAYNNKLKKYNSFGELSTPIEEAWPSLNRYFIPRWASLLEDESVNEWAISKNGLDAEIVSSYTEIDYPLVIVPAHGGDIGPKYNMEGYVDTDLWSAIDFYNPLFFTEISPDYQWMLTEAAKPPPRYSYNFMPGKFVSSFHKSRYIKDSIDFEYPFNKNISSSVETKKAIGHYPEFRPNTELIEFTPPPPGVFFHAKDIAYQNLLENNKYKIEPIAGDSEVGCSSCSIPFTGAKISAWGFDLKNDDIINAVQEITELTGDVIRDKELGNLDSKGVWLGIAKDRVASGGRIIKRLRLMFPIELNPGETIMFGRGVNINNTSTTQLNDGYSYKITVTGSFKQYPNDENKIKPGQLNKNYEYRWGRFSDECSCNSRISLEDPNYIDTDSISHSSAVSLLQKYQNEPENLTTEERASLIVGDETSGGIALVKYANCENTITYLESGASPKLQVYANSYSGSVGLTDMSTAWPIWNKSMCGNGYGCANNTPSFHIGELGNEIIDPLILYSGKGPGMATTWHYVVIVPYLWEDCFPTHSMSGSGIRGFWSDWLSNRGYSNFYTANTKNPDDDKDRVAGDIPFEASHPQGWLGAGFVHPTDGYWTTQIGGDSIGDLIQVEYKLPDDDCNMVPPNVYNTTSGTQFSSLSLYYALRKGYPDVMKNWYVSRAIGPDAKCLEGIPLARHFFGDDPSNPSNIPLPFPRTQNKKKQNLKMCCFGENYLNETPSSVTNSVLSDRYSFNVRKNKYRNLYNGMFRSHPISNGYQITGIIFRKWHGDPFNPIDRDKRLKGIVSPVWADYWWAWDYNSYCPDGYDWFKNIKEWRHRRWELPLFLGTNKDNISTMFINDPDPLCTPETCSGLELYDTSFIGAFGGYKLGWNHRKYDSPTSHFILNPGSMHWIESTRGANSSSVYNEVTPPRACQCNSQSSLFPKTGTLYAMNNAIWYNCYFDAKFPDIFGNDVRFTIDYSRWNPYFQYLGPGFIQAFSHLKTYSADIKNVSWPST